MTAFIHRELHQRVRNGFSILLPATDAVILFGDNLKLPQIAVVSQEHRQLRLILNLSAQPDEVTSSVNETTSRESAPESMQFGSASHRILQAIWEADPVQGPVQVSKMDVTDAYHRVTLQPSHVGAFAYIVPAASKDNCVIICINIVLPMGWVNSPKYLCLLLETLTDVANDLVHTSLPVPAYGAILEIPETGPGPHHTIYSLTHIDCYMDDVITEVQGGDTDNAKSLTARSGH